MTSKLKEAQQSFILNEATKLFLEKSISNVTMSDIASYIGIGEATLYRYFGKKQNLVIKVAEALSKNILEKYFTFDESKTGFENIKEFYLAYLKVFKEDRDYYSFVYSLDAYIHNEIGINLETYNDNVNLFKEVFYKYFKKGINDNSIKEDISMDIYYRTTSIALLSFCKKLAVENILQEDSLSSKEGEIETLIELFLFRIKK